MRETLTSRAGIGVKFARSVRSPAGVVMSELDGKGARRMSIRTHIYGVIIFRTIFVSFDYVTFDDNSHASRVLK